VRHLVEAHGGEVDVHSDGPGQGATFSIVLPIRAIDISEAEAEAEREGEREAENTPMRFGGAMTEQPLTGVRVLHVEDDSDSLELVRVVLEAAGAVVTSVESARKALELREPFHLIISDVGMPEVDGYTLMKCIRARRVGGDVPGIALTAYVGEDNAERAKRAGFQEHLPKPVNPRVLVETVHRWSHQGAG
jgi:CheY-like chemotaxis protein